MRKSPRCYNLFLGAVLLALPAPVYAQQVSQPRQSPHPPPDYRRDTHFRYFLGTHKDPLWKPWSISPEPTKGVTEHLLHMTWFLGSPGVGMQMTVSYLGQVYSVREVHNYALRASHRWLLTPTEVATLQHDLQGVKQDAKAGDPELPLKDLVIVSFGQGKNRKTLLCDVNKLPASVRELMHGPPQGR